MRDVVPLQGSVFELLAESLNVRRGDTIELKFVKGLWRSRRVYEDGRVETSRAYMQGKLRTLTFYDGAKMSVADRVKLVKRLYAEGHTQTEIAQLIGVSQSTVSNDIRRRR